MNYEIKNELEYYDIKLNFLIKNLSEEVQIF